MFERIKNIYTIHKTIAVGLSIIIIGAGGYGIYEYMQPSVGETTYVTQKIVLKDITTTASGSGQVLSSSEVSLTPDASGKIVSIIAKNGDIVAKGAPILSIDSTTARQDVRDARTVLETAELELEELLEPADASDIAEAKYNLIKAQEDEQDAEENLETFNDTYAETYNDTLTELFVELEDTMDDFDGLLYDDGYNSSVGGHKNVIYYEVRLKDYVESPYDLRVRITDMHASAQLKYEEALNNYSTINTFSDTTDIKESIVLSQEVTELVIEAMSGYSDLITLSSAKLVGDNKVPAKLSEAHISTLSNLITVVRSYNTTLQEVLDTTDSLLEAQADAQEALRKKEDILADLQEGADSLTVRSKNITIDKKKNDLWDAQETLADYTLRAPFAGILTDFNVMLGERVSTSSNIGTLITTQHKADIDFNEVDFIDIKKGQKALVTFDAVEGIEVEGEVSELDIVGTVTSGVVTYGVEIIFRAENNDIKPGMSLSVDIIIASSNDVIVIPGAAITERNGRQFVQVLENGMPRMVEVTLGVENDTQSEVLTGLTEGMELITKTVQTSDANTADSKVNGTTGLGGLLGGVGGGPPLGGGGTRTDGGSFGGNNREGGR